ncbi:2-hydroxyacid dehydrogenase [Rubellimicrobium sp. CFH 75288]|uniref:2-hydroxyacid dehydrogenase n=1 Tax=Rubellimicrobium sp. CFH 75288 TaxID=2697034 RepID=UPI0014130F32|nr:2-hydroxyacid dehydrogenase [Rubellimicrobium sp. CFH 75288]NAZ36248.1 2-hydroxyacid dehydrogenase [Rubellimicrobium sp. CFH 75288]
MRVAVFSAKPHDEHFLRLANEAAGHDLRFLEPRLSPETAPLADGHDAVCAFVNDDLGAATIERLAAAGVRMIALRSAGFNHVDLEAAQAAGLAVGRVPAYSPHAVAEHTMALILALNRRIHRAYNRVREGNFALDGLLGFDIHGKTVGIVGTGLIGSILARILHGFGCRILAHDPRQNPDCLALGVRYVDLPTLLGESDIVTLQCPLTPQTHHMINADTIRLMRRGAMLINTSRGAVVDTPALIEGLKDGTIGSLGLDVYEEEEGLFFEDLSNTIIPDDTFARLLTFPNVLITGHQAFFTREALTAIAETTIANLSAFERDGRPVHPVPPPPAGAG